MRSESCHDIIIAPVVSEKSYSLVDKGKYTFEVNVNSNKSVIKSALEEIFDVKIASINIINRLGKSNRSRFGIGKRKNIKRAIVVLKKGSIDVFSDIK